MGYWDTSRDPRILMALVSSGELGRLVPSARSRGPWPKREVLGFARKANSIINNLRFTYMDPRAMAETEEVRLLAEGADSLLRALEVALEPDLTGKRILFHLGIIAGLGRRLSLGRIDDPVVAVDLYAGEVQASHEHPEIRGLKVCRVWVGRPMTVVTNDLSVEEGDRVGVAVLPPREFGGIISEGMFLGHGGVRRGVRGEPGGLPRGLRPEDLSEASRLVASFIREHLP
ncbi:MAG: tRNA-binding protein [Thermoplasmata archaeon]|nr:MAG: tRNA-binding protein [Thermoplasmata archaeon]